MPINLTFQFLTIAAGALVDADTLPVLQDSGSTYGIIRNDSIIVVPVGTPVTRDGVGQYSYLLKNAVEGSLYRAVMQYTLSAVPAYVQDVMLADQAESTPLSDFFTLAEFNRRWGSKNVVTASNKDNNNTTADSQALQEAFDYATSWIYDELQGGIYAIPLQFTGDVPAKVKDWAMVIAYDYLYFSRGMEDKDRRGNKITPLRARVEDEIAFVRAGIRQIDAVHATDYKGTAVGVGAEAFALPPLSVRREPDELPVTKPWIL